MAIKPSRVLGHHPAIHSHGWAPRLPAGHQPAASAAVRLPQSPASEPVASAAEGAEGKRSPLCSRRRRRQRQTGAGRAEEGAVEVEVGAVVG